MDKNAKARNLAEIYLDELTVYAAYRLFRTQGVSKITVLGEIKPKQRLWRWLLRNNGIQVVEADFFAGHLKNADGEGVWLSGRRLAGKLSLQAAKDIVQSERFLRRLNEAYGRNTLILFFAKLLHLHIEYWTLRAMVARSLRVNEDAEVWLKKPIKFDEKILREALPDISLRFYPSTPFGFTGLALDLIFDLARDMKLTVVNRLRRPFSRPTQRQTASILTLQSDHIRLDRSLRRQLHWVNTDQPSDSMDTYVVEFVDKKYSEAGAENRLSQMGVTLLPLSDLGSAIHAMKGNKILQHIRRDRHATYRAVLHLRGYANKFFLLRAAFLLRQAELMGAMALWLNAKVFLNGEPSYSLSDAMQLVAPDLGVTTIAYQYSNMGFVSPLMMSTADTFLLFSDMYRSLYEVEDISPQAFLSTGYLFDGIANIVRDKARKHRKILTDAGAKFIICYFDESVQNDRWGMVCQNDHLDELHALARNLLADPEMGVVVKSQFTRNSPSQLYPADELIQAAKATGRYLELIEGTHSRNDIYPTEAALVADLCIGHKFGATASLEAAIAGVRSVLIDFYGMSTLLDAMYSQAQIEYKTIESLLDAVGRFRAGDADQQAIGDWAPILHHFDPHRDGQAADRLRAVIKQAMVRVS